MKRLLPFLALPLAACATLPSSAAGPTAALGQQAYVDGLRVTPLKVLEDSRCPINARCVWAGRIIVRAAVAGGNWRRSLDLELGKPEQVADGQLTLVAAEPGKMAGAPADPARLPLHFHLPGRSLGVHLGYRGAVDFVDRGAQHPVELLVALVVAQVGQQAPG